MENDEEQEFWRDEPTQRLRRVSAELPLRGSRSHTGAIPVVHVRSTESEAGERSWRGWRGWRSSRDRQGDGRLDPFWPRIGMVFAAFALLVPVALIVRSVGGTDDTARRLAVATVTQEAGFTTAATSGAPSPAAEGAGAAAAAAPALGPVTSVDPGLEAPAVTEADQQAVATEAAAAGLISPETKSAPTIPAKVTCTNTYTVKAGDYWLGIAQKTGASIKDLLSANSATARTVLFAGRKVCLPAGAKAPSATTKPKTAATSAAAPSSPAATSAPATAAATTTAAPAPTPTAAPTTSAPVTTARPAAARPATTTTSTPAGPAPAKGLYTRDQVAQIIRDVWPDDQEDKAIAIATRESNLQPEVRNHCCFGLFQIYFSVHKSWLTAMGITSAEMLYDPVNNAKAALALYNRAGGWGPWGG